MHMDIYSYVHKNLAAGSDGLGEGQQERDDQTVGSRRLTFYYIYHFVSLEFYTFNSISNKIK